MIRSRLKRLRLDKEETEGRKLSYKVICEETNLSEGVIVRLMNSQFDRVDAGSLNALCRYFGCGVGDILEYLPDGSAPEAHPMNVPQEDLNLWRRFCDTLRATCRVAMQDIDAGNVQHARRMLEQTEDAGRRLALRLEKAGASGPDAPAPSLDAGTPLALLDTPANRRYAEKLQEAWEAPLAWIGNGTGKTSARTAAPRPLKWCWPT